MADILRIEEMGPDELRRFKSTPEYLRLPASRREYITNLERMRRLERTLPGGIPQAIIERPPEAGGFPTPSVREQYLERRGVERAETPQYSPSAEDLTSEAIAGRALRSFLPSPAVAEPPAPPPPAPPAPDREQPPESTVDAMRRFLGQPGAGGGGRAFAVQQGKFEDPEAYKQRVMAELPEERKAQPTYKADQGMALLETGLKILAAQPKLGQGALGQIAGPVAEGVREYRGEREKQRLSEKEEAKESREDKLRMAGIKRDIENSTFDRDKAIKTYNLETDKLREMQRHNMSSEALSAQSQKVAMAGVLVQSANVDIARDTLKANLARQPAQIFRDLESSGVIDRVSELQGKRESGARLSPQESAELARATLEIGLKTGNYAGLLRSDTAQDRVAAANAAALMKQAKDLVATDPDRARELERRAMQFMMQSMGLSTEAPAAPQSLMLPR